MFLFLYVNICSFRKACISHTSKGEARTSCLISNGNQRVNANTIKAKSVQPTGQ